MTSFTTGTLVGLVVGALLTLLVTAGPCHAQDVEGITQTDRMCIGRRVIVQTMDLVKNKGESKDQYIERAVQPYAKGWTQRQWDEVNAVINYVWSHDSEDNQRFAGAAMEACYQQNKDL